MILRIMTAVPSKLRLDASTPLGTPRAAVAPPYARTRAHRGPGQNHWNSYHEFFVEMVL